MRLDPLATLVLAPLGVGIGLASVIPPAGWLYLAAVVAVVVIALLGAVVVVLADRCARIQRESDARQERIGVLVAVAREHMPPAELVALLVGGDR